MKKIFMICILFMYTYTSTNAQRLKIGEKCPDKILKHVFNFKTDSLRLSQFNVDLIILDFWGLSCISCIQAFPKIDALQKKFNGRVQIIAVNKQTLEHTADFFAKRKKIQIPSVPFITQATLLSEWFPQEFVPWHVWLDKNLIVRYITFGHNATEENIEAFLNKKYPVMQQ